MEDRLSGFEFQAWLEAMRAKGLIVTEGDAGQLLGRRKQWVSLAKVQGVDTMAALACAALLVGIKPFRSGREA